MKAIQRSQRRSPQQAGPGISLFPFLAVLICTMGALVPLLLAITRTARMQAQAAAVAKLAGQGAELQTQREDVGWRIEHLKSSRTKTESQLSDARLELGHLEDHSRRLREEFGQHQRALDDLEGLENVDQTRLAQSRTELEQVRTQIGAAEGQLADAHRAAADGRRRSYAVVPYEGPNQTRRRPIYLECREDAVVLQPEGIELSEADFEGPLGPGNPLAAALRAAREYMLAQRDFDPQAGEPYPMLLVRPEGINAYYAARAAMKSWGFEFGYELIDDGWNLAYPPPDPQLADVVRQVIASARISQARLAAAAPRHYAQRPRVAYRASPSHGGFVREETGSGVGGQGSGVGGQGSGVRGQGSGVRGQGSGVRGQGSGDDGPPDNLNGFAAERPGTAVPGGQDGDSAGGAGGVGVAAGVGGGTGGTGPYVASAERPGTAVPGGQDGSGVGSAGVPGGVGVATGVGGATGETGPYASSAERPGTAVPGGLGGSGGGSGGGSAGGVGGATGVETDTGDGGPALTGAAGPGHPLRDGGTEGTADGQQQETSGKRTSGNPYRSSVASSHYGSLPKGEGTAEGNAAPRGDAVERPEGYIVGQPVRERIAAAQPAASDGARRGRVLRPGEWEPTPDPPPTERNDKRDKKDKDKDDDVRGERRRVKPPPKTLTEKRGADWGLRDAARGSVGVTRPISVECHADRLVVVSDRGPADSKTVPLGPRLESSIDTFISAVWEHMETWGMAGRGMYWRPLLQVHVAPNAEQRFADLSVLLEGSGLTVERK